MGSDEYQQVVPGFFALTCDIPLVNSLTCPLIIHSEQKLRDLPFRDHAIQILKNNFEEIEIQSRKIQIRKLNITLSEQSKEDLLKELNIVMPAFSQMLKLISNTSSNPKPGPNQKLPSFASSSLGSKSTPPASPSTTTSAKAITSRNSEARTPLQVLPI